MAYMYGINAMLGGDFFTYVLPWLFTFAIVFGILSHVETPKSRSARTIISLVLAFIVAPVLSPFVGVLMSMIGSLVVLIAGILVFIVFLEIVGIKGVVSYKDDKGKTKYKRKSIFIAHGTAFAVLFIIIGVIVFIGSGGLEALGWTGLSANLIYNYPLLFFLIVVALAIWWMASED